MRIRCEVRHRRREEQGHEGVGYAPDGLVETRKRIDCFGLGDHDFRLSILRPCELKGVAAIPDMYAIKLDRLVTLLVHYVSAVED